MNLQASRIAVAIFATLLLILVPDVHSGSVSQTQIKNGAEAVLERDGKKVFLNATSASFHLAEFVTKGKAKTVLVEGELLQHLEITDDLGAKGDETGKVRLTIRPISRAESSALRWRHVRFPAMSSKSILPRA